MAYFLVRVIVFLSLLAGGSAVRHGDAAEVKNVRHEDATEIQEDLTDIPEPILVEEDSDDDSIRFDKKIIKRCWKRVQKAGPDFAACIKDEKEDEYTGYYYVVIAHGPIVGFDTRAYIFAKYDFGGLAILIWKMYNVGE
ncbi:unnamed protein product [Symbiodinium sp. CCMP2456]|nr:unnamed protein product [Symbiodinium sp. CCMP2456]